MSRASTTAIGAQKVHVARPSAGTDVPAHAAGGALPGGCGSRQRTTAIDVVLIIDVPPPLNVALPWSAVAALNHPPYSTKTADSGAPRLVQCTAVSYDQVKTRQA